MSSGRSIKGESPCAYRVVMERYGRTTYYGPYSTLGAAKGKRTTEEGYHSRWETGGLKIWIEKTPDGWEEVK